MKTFPPNAGELTCLVTAKGMVPKKQYSYVSPFNRFSTLLFLQLLFFSTLKADVGVPYAVYSEYNVITKELTLTVDWVWTAENQKTLSVAVFADINSDGHTPGPMTDIDDWTMVGLSSDEFLGQLASSSIDGTAWSDGVSSPITFSDNTDAGLAVSRAGFLPNTPRSLLPYGFANINAAANPSGTIPPGFPASSVVGTFMVRYTNVAVEPETVCVVLYDIHLDGNPVTFKNTEGNHSPVTVKNSSSPDFDKRNADNSEEDGYNGNLIQCGPVNVSLPVEFGEFRANHYKEGVLLNWTTYSEVNNLGFEIQRSRNGYQWENVHFIEGNGTTDETTIYEYFDRNPFLGNNYYRLKQLDFDDQYSFSGIQNIQIISAGSRFIQVFPNPSDGKFVLNLSNPETSNARIRLLDSRGSLIWKMDLREHQELTYWEKEFDLPPGEVYFIIVQIDNQTYTRKITVIDEK